MITNLTKFFLFVYTPTPDYVSMQFVLTSIAFIKYVFQEQVFYMYHLFCQLFAYKDVGKTGGRNIQWNMSHICASC